MRFVATGLLLAACVSMQPALLMGQTVRSDVGKLDFDSTVSLVPLLDHDEKTPSAARGIWRVKGYGYLVQIDAETVTLFNETPEYIWKTADTDLDTYWIKIDRTGDFAQLTESPGIPPVICERIDRIPQAYDPDIDWTPSRVYRVFDQIMMQDYGFFRERGIDWPNTVAKFRSIIDDQSTDQQLFSAIRDPLSQIDDAHLQLTATIDGESLRANLSASHTLQQLQIAFRDQSQHKDFDQFVQSRIVSHQQAMKSKILADDFHQSCEQLVWGKTVGDVGYLYIDGMSGFAADAKLAEELAVLHEAMNHILTELADTRALIIDVATNGGGADQYSFAIAGHFTDQQHLGFSKGPRNHPEFRHHVFIDPYNGEGAVRYTKPIFLVTSDLTTSAAEIFVLCMKDLDHVTTIGTKTRGALSDVLVKTLPNGWTLGLSNEVYLDSHDVCYEGRGIPTDREKTVIDPMKTDTGHALAILEIAMSIE